MEYLSRLLHNLNDIREFKFHPRCGKLGINHMCFADDLLLFSRGDVASITMIQQCFNEFSKSSGLLANLGKSSVYFGGISLVEEVNILTRLGFSHGEFPFKYLGIPLSTQKITLIQWKPLITRITARISSWIARKLSYAGRAQLIQFVIFGIQAFYAQLFMTPTKVIKMIESYCRSYLWSGRNTITKKALLTWETLCLPKCVGGLNLTNLRLWKKAS
ncbi:hypothetical protein KY290_005225 [Solanum tuberosum]|uniref:Non-LTR retroelement reverse transcriptase n=1 Tax=Solanum tuberosum TaxID=4113 RepID=A0ABQ7WFB9_SOLTU|nr:hypothetical protein KY289_005617 [Solanum tuberosum]KAH0751956.1 hypothetical protein KY285_005104 [Solanum tuberosum]KAH0778798.1 hypothetical protein KY290_005225 [Solanum tuberosum]